MAEPGLHLRIACLAWGSLLWKRGPLRLGTAWSQGGPSLPIEFVRIGDQGELATTLWTRAARVPTRWAVLDATSVAGAREMLRQREEIDPAHPEYVGTWVGTHVGTDSAADASVAPFTEEIGAWAALQRLDAVVWTALPPRSSGVEGRAPTVDEAIRYLQGLEGDTRHHALDYIRQVPADIRTPYRAAFEARLGLLPSQA